MSRKMLEAFKAGFLQFCPVIGVGNVYKGLRPLPQIFPIQAGDSVLRNNIVNMAPGGNHPGSLF